MEPTLEAQFDDNRTLISTLHYLVQTQSDGHVRLETPDGRWGNLYLDGGRVVYVHTSEGKTAAHLADLTTREKGAFRFYKDVPAPEQTLRVLLTSLLPADIVLDDTASDSQRVVHLTGESVLIANENLTLQDNTASLNYIGVQMLLHIDGKRSLAVIAQLAQQPLESIIRIAQDLSDMKMLQLVGTRPLAVSPRFFTDLRRMAAPYFGPIVEFLIDDCIEDLGYDIDTFPPGHVSRLFTMLRQKLERDDWQDAFKKDFYLLCKQYGINLKKRKAKA